jgi:hypothetical protein
LISIADMADGRWPARARGAALVLSTGRGDAEGDSAGVLLLTDIRRVFGAKGVDRLASKDLVAALTALEDAPWGSLREGRGLNQNGLGRRLRAYDILSRTVRFDDETTAKGYLRRQFEDAWSRYAPPGGDSETTHEHNPHQERDCDDSQSDTSPRCDASQNGSNPNSHAGCGDVSFWEPSPGGETAPEPPQPSTVDPDHHWLGRED